DEYATLHATLEDAASHRTGMPRHEASYGGPDFNLRDVVRNFRNLPLTAEIRTRFQYCNMMYMTLSHVIERLTDSWLGDVLWNRIWNPLNMTHTYFSFAQAKRASESGAADLATGYTWNNRTQEYAKTPWMDIPLVSGAGNVISNVEDYAKWLRFLMDQPPPLSKTGHQSLRHPRTILEDSPLPGFVGPSSYGLGWNIENYRGEPLISHAGGLPGFGALIGYLPERRYGIALMGNTADTSNIVEYILFTRLLDDFLGIPDKDRGDIASVFEKFVLGPKRREVEDPIGALYPSAPTGEKAIPLSLPLENYTGVYFNTGYRNITITLSPTDPEGVHIHPCHHSLQSIMDRSWVYEFEFQHVSGEYFIMKGYLGSSEEEFDMTDPFHVILLKAEFRLGEDGEVAELGVLLEPEMGERKIWFMRVGDVE
ncbi:MAG: hypothetical protein L6R39_005779, partial [Caloplaca ligustica]